MKISTHFLILFFLPVLFYSCTADIDLSNISNEVSLHPGLIVPIGGASITLGQIITNNDSTGKFVIGNNAEISYVSFDSTQFVFPTLNLLQNSQPLTKNIHPCPSGIMVLPGNYSLQTLQSKDSILLGTNANKNGDRIDSLRITTMVLNVNVDVSPELSSILPSDLKYTIVFPPDRIRKLDGTPAVITFAPTGYGCSNTVQMNDFMMITSNRQERIPITIKLDVTTGAVPVSLSQSSVITSKINFSQLEYAVAYGVFNSNINLTNSYIQNINFDKNLPPNSIKLVNPQVSISAVSNLGSCLDFKIDYIKAYHSTNPGLNPVFANFGGNKFTNVSIKSKPAQPSDTIDIRLPVINNAWGETTQLFESTVSPDRLEYDFSASVDTTLNNQCKTPSFITSNASLKVKIKTTVPMDFNKGSFYVYQDSIPNLFGLIANALDQFKEGDITYTVLVLNITNGLPVKTTFQFALKDQNGNSVLTDFIKDYTIKAGTVDAGGLVQPGKEAKQTIEISVTKDQLALLRTARTITYSVRMEGEDANSNIHFISSNTFDLKVGLFVKGDVNTTIGGTIQK